MGKVFSQKHEVAYYECDINQTMTFPAMVSVAVKASSDQSDQLDRGAAYVNQLGVTWVITQYEMAITRLPKVGEIITVYTEPIEYNRYFCYRDYWITDAAGTELLRVEAAFVLMDLKNRKISSVNEAVMAPYESPKIKKIRRWSKIESIEKGEMQPYRVRFYDLDSNQHVNNAMYFNWMIDVLGYDFMTTHDPKRVNIRYDKEVHYGSTVESWFEVNPTENGVISCHEIRFGEQLCCEANIFWEKKAEE